MTDHTPEPWHYENEEPGTGYSRHEPPDPGYPACIHAELGDEEETWVEIARMSDPGYQMEPAGEYDSGWQPYGNADANARRIAAAVNACAGISTDDLEDGDLVRRLAAADALAVMLDELLEWLEDDEYTPESILSPARAALRRYRGKEKCLACAAGDPELGPQHNDNCPQHAPF